jgi:acetyl-CoA acyltransferase
VTRACASGLQAITDAVSAIERGDADVLIAGGSDSTSNAAVNLPNKAVHALAPLAFGKAKGMQDYLGVLAQLMPLSDIMPSMPKIAERTTGEVMGESAEKMARRNGITRQEQDALAARSHRLRGRGRQLGSLRVRGHPRRDQQGLGPRGHHHPWRHQRREAGQAAPRVREGRHGHRRQRHAPHGRRVLHPAHERREGRGARLHGPRAFRSWSYVGVDPTDQLLMGPAIAMPRALERAGLELADVDLVDIHEAFAAQVLSVPRCWAARPSPKSAWAASTAVGTIDDAKLNVHGGPSRSVTRSAPPARAWSPRWPTSCTRPARRPRARHLRRRRPRRGRGARARLKEERPRHRRRALHV